MGTQAISATTDAAVAVALNNTPFIRNRFFEQEFYDLARVEVLRGPQGTLYGRNATAGVVNILSAKPKFGYEAKLSADLGNYNSTRLEGMINLPLVEDKVALRLAGAWTKRDGYDTNQISGNRIDGRDLWSTRLSLRVAPTDNIEANLIWEHFQEDDDRLRSGKQLCHTDDRTEIEGHSVPAVWGYSAIFSQGCLAASLYAPESFEVPNGYALPYYLPLGAIFLPVRPGMNPYASVVQSHDLRVIESNVDPSYRAKSDVVEAQESWQIDNLSLTAETSYSSDFIFSTEDYNRFNTARGVFSPTLLTRPPRVGVLSSNEYGGVFCDPQLGCSDRLVAVDLSTARSQQFSQELRLSSDYGGPLNFSAGINFLRYDTVDKYYVFINTLTMYAAIAKDFSMPAYVPGLSDNHECLLNGDRVPEPSTAQSVEGCVYIDPNPIGNLNDQGHNYFLSKNPYKLISYAVFGEAYYSLTDALKITAGLRWTVDKKEAPRIPSWILGGGAYTDSGKVSGSIGYPVMDVVRQEWREPTGRVAVDWKPRLPFADETLLYASYARGYKAGGANPPPSGTVVANFPTLGNAVAQTLVTKPRTFGPEFVNAFEIGTKNTLLDGAVTLNMAAFYYDYQGYQISQIIDRSAVNYNFDATVAGLELEAGWRPVENLKFGLKIGYEDTRLADGSKAIDIMDRTAGKPGWIVVRPYPTQASNCILPLYVFGNHDLGASPNEFINGGPSACEVAYLFGQDPVTQLRYVPNPTVERYGANLSVYFPGYIGFDPTTAPNNGEGFDKNLSGHELPNAPHYTASFVADYTLPLPDSWLLTLHSDLYYQSEAWARVFNTPGYDKLKAYTNVNLAAILSNDDGGWKVMAYVKNVFDHDSITGAFLNSDDTGLTTNVFLNEPRLYGLRVTKEFAGAGRWAGSSVVSGPLPFTIEFGGEVERQDAPYTKLTPQAFAQLPASLDPTSGLQNRDLDWGDGRTVRLTYNPSGSTWNVSAGWRTGETNNDVGRAHVEEEDTYAACGFPAWHPYAAFLCTPTSPYYLPFLANVPRVSWSDATSRDHEKHQIVDFAVGRDAPLAQALSRSSLEMGLRYAEFRSESAFSRSAKSSWNVPDGWLFYGLGYQTSTAALHANRKFAGAGPVLSWRAAAHLVGTEAAGHLDLDWSATAGELFGRQTSVVTGTSEIAQHWGTWGNEPFAVVGNPSKIQPPRTRSKSVGVPLLDLSLGLSYEIQRIKLSTGYRWERYYNVLDGGYAEHKSYDRTVDGPYFKIAVGFGG
ncbi:MAG: TonB-dependent receptor domain-containing protein [Ignavibacteriales bacterium]